MSGDEFSVDAAREAAGRDELGAWVSRFLASPGSDNRELGEMLSERLRFWVGPLKLPLDELNRLAGPPDAPVLVALDEDDWHDRVDDMAKRAGSGWEPPPVIVSYRNEELVLEDGNHRVESIRRAGQSDAWAVVGFEDERARDVFLRGRLSSL